MGGQTAHWWWKKQKTHVAGNLTTSTHFAWQDDNTLRFWTSGASTLPCTLTDTHTERVHFNSVFGWRGNTKLLVVGRRHNNHTSATCSATAEEHMGQSGSGNQHYTHMLRGAAPLKHHSKDPANHNAIFILVTTGWSTNRSHSQVPHRRQLNIFTSGQQWE